MRPSPKLHPTAWDALVVLCVAALAIALALFQWRGGTSQGLTAVVSVDGTEIDRVSLEDAAGSTRVRTSNCPTQDCVHTGVVSRGGQSIVCLPARIVIRLEGGAPDPDAVDAVLG